MKFTLTIELGNDAMQTRADIRAALRKLACNLCEIHPHHVIRRADAGTLRDINGNRVGGWEIAENAPR